MWVCALCSSHSSHSRRLGVRDGQRYVGCGMVWIIYCGSGVDFGAWNFIAVMEKV